MTEVVLHIGLHKTGSTFLQHAMQALEPALAERGVALRPREVLYQEEGFHRVVRRLQKGANVPAKLRRQVADQVRPLLHPYGLDRVLVSDETLLGLLDFELPGNAYTAGLPALRWMVDDVAGPGPSRVIMYVRRQDRFLESVFVQRIHDAHFQTFDDWYSRIDARRFDWLELAQRIEEIVGPGNVAVRPFETIGEGPVGFCRDFLKTIDPALDLELPTSEIEGVARQHANPGLSGKGLEVALRAYPVLTAEERRVLRRFLQRRFSNRDYPRAKLLSDEEAGRVLEYHRRGNRVLFERYASGVDPAPLGYMV